MSLAAFFAYLVQLSHMSCIALTESTHSQIIYGGNCSTAFLLALQIPGVAWVFWKVT